MVVVVVCVFAVSWLEHPVAMLTLASPSDEEGGGEAEVGC